MSDLPTANRGTTWKGDIAIDNLQLHNDVCCKSFIVNILQVAVMIIW